MRMSFRIMLIHDLPAQCYQTVPVPLPGQVVHPNPEPEEGHIIAASICHQNLFHGNFRCRRSIRCLHMCHRSAIPACRLDPHGIARMDVRPKPVCPPRFFSLPPVSLHLAVRSNGNAFPIDIAGNGQIGSGYKGIMQAVGGMDGMEGVCRQKPCLQGDLPFQPHRVREQCRLAGQRQKAGDDKIYLFHFQNVLV